MAERDLFSGFKPRWWDVVSVAAAARTYRDLQIEVQPLLFGLIVGLLAIVTTLLSAGLAAATESMKTSLLNGAMSTAAFLGWYGWNIWRAANDVHDEQQGRIEDLELSLANRPRLSEIITGKLDVTLQPVSAAAVAVSAPPAVIISEGQSLADRLIQFRIDGVKLRNERIDSAAFSEWKDRVHQWKADVIEAIKSQANLADVARFAVLDRVPVMDFKWALGARHTKTLRELSRRIDILLEIMAKL